METKGVKSLFPQAAALTGGILGERMKHYRRDSSSALRRFASPEG